MHHGAPLLIDVGQVADPCCVDDALETLHKALSNPPEHDIWAPHESPFIRDLIERFTHFGLMQLQEVVDELQQWLSGSRSQPGPGIPAPSAPWALTAQELGLARVYLAHLPLEHWTLWDVELLVEYLIGRHLPPAALRSEAEKLAVRSTLMGRVQASHPELGVESVRAVVAGLPASVAVAQAQFRLPAVAQAVLQYGHLHCAETVAAASDAFRHRIKSIVLEHQGQVLFGEQPATGLQSKLLDALGEANRDWRRIALTEAGEMANQGLVSALTPGERVRRLEAYKGACPFCRKLDGRIFRVTSADDPEKDGERDIWPGKTNQGRSASPMKRGPFGLVERTKAELWWPAAGTQHPHCRGQWHREAPAPAGSSDEFAAWLEQHLAQGRVVE